MGSRCAATDPALHSAAEMRPPGMNDVIDEARPSPDPPIWAAAFVDSVDTVRTCAARVPRHCQKPWSGPRIATRPSASPRRDFDLDDRVAVLTALPEVPTPLEEPRLARAHKGSTHAPTRDVPLGAAAARA
jgi:hypothetical protein